MGGNELVIANPAPALRSWVDCYVGYRQSGVRLGLHRGLPSRSVTMVISLAEPIRLVGGPGAQAGPLALRAAVSGLQFGPALIEQDAFQEGIHVCLNPLGVQRLLGVSAPELAGAVHDLRELPVRSGHNLVDRLSAATEWSARFAILDEQFEHRIDEAPVTLMGEVQWAWRQLERGAGTARIAELAEQVGWSRRHFGQKFAHAVGVSPKQAARLMRFERSNALLRDGEVRTLAQLAVECGYYDQAHLTHEWRQLAGCTPSTWIAEELPFLQDDGAGPSASSMS